jgi:metallophosphoesterase superfamily enzyme
MIRIFQEWLLTPWRLAVHEPTATAVIADVHLGYREARQDAGDAVPLLPVREQLGPLAEARRQARFERLVVAGDLFESGVHPACLREFLHVLDELEIEWAGLVPGNHDRGWEALRGDMPVFPDGIQLGPWHVMHSKPAERQRGQCVVGHWHPMTTLAGLRVPCYLAEPTLLVLPAFSADAAGLPAERQPQWRGMRVLAIDGDRVHG